MAMNFEIYAAFAVWWSVAIPVLALAMVHTDDFKESVSFAVFWPFFAIMGCFGILWRIPFKSAKAIRADLKNRGVLKEFDKWLLEQEKNSAQEQHR